MTKLRSAIERAIDGFDRVTCAEVADRAGERLGYEPSLPAVSRTLSSMGWRKTDVGGKVGFIRESRQ